MEEFKEGVGSSSARGSSGAAQVVTCWEVFARFAVGAFRGCKWCPPLGPGRACPRGGDGLWFHALNGIVANGNANANARGSLVHCNARASSAAWLGSDRAIQSKRPPPPPGSVGAPGSKVLRHHGFSIAEGVAVGPGGHHIP